MNIKNPWKPVLLLLGIVSVLLLVSCKEDNEDLQLYIQSVAESSLHAVETLPEDTSEFSFTFPEESRRDPFKKSDGLKNSHREINNPLQKAESLESFSLDTLKFKGILKDGSLAWGLIAQPDGKIVKVRAGNYIGQNKAKILSIHKDNIKLEEIVKQQEKWKRQVISLPVDSGSEQAKP